MNDAQRKELFKRAGKLTAAYERGSQVGADTAEEKFAAYVDSLISAERERTLRGSDKSIGFYEREFYPLSNFSAFAVSWLGIIFPTSEHAYHFTRFPGGSPERTIILESPSAHEAFRFAQEHKSKQLGNWAHVKVDVMRSILSNKAHQHEYVRRKLLESGERKLIEDSWRDDFWGSGPKGDGQNMLGKLWMEVRAAIRART